MNTSRASDSRKNSIQNSDTNAASSSRESGGALRPLNRREALKWLGGSAAAAWLARWPAMAGPFTRKDFERLVPADKRLTPAWLRSLTERGERARYSGAELEKIGMPVGGLCAGQVYLGGDGRLWHWDIFNQHIRTGAEHYAKPLRAQAPFELGFALGIAAPAGNQATSRGQIPGRDQAAAAQKSPGPAAEKSQPSTSEQARVRTLDSTGWKEVSFVGEYPIGFVDYSDPAAPVSVRLEAFSPFAPLETDDSSLPATLLHFTIRNTGNAPVGVELGGWLENPVCLHSGAWQSLRRVNRIERRDGALRLECAAEGVAVKDEPPREDIVFDDFERADHGDWTAEGTAFGQGPITQEQVPAYQGTLGLHGRRAINSHVTGPGTTSRSRDSAKGRLTSRAFTIERRYINCLIGGGAHKGRTCINLLVDGSVVASVAGPGSNQMRPATLDVRRWSDRQARLQIVDDEAGGWGQIAVDHIVFSDRRALPPGALAEEADFGTMSLALLPSDAAGAQSGVPGSAVDFSSAEFAGEASPASVFAAATRAVGAAGAAGNSSAQRRPVGGLGRRWTLPPGAAVTARFVVAWHFPNLRMDRLPPGRHYATRFASASAVVDYIARHHDRLADMTRRWHAAWHDSTLPHWLLDRTMLNTSILASSTCYRFGDGRFYGWEGVGCCAGTCGHVWHYAHAVGRLFPELERLLRERVDFGIAMQPDGAIHFRGEFNKAPAVDGQAGAVLRALREHQMSRDDAFLRRNWPQIKRAVRWLIAQDGDGDGLLEGKQHNTLDADWYGPVAWLSGLYQAALLAAEAMALEVGETAFASECRALADRGRTRLVERLFDGDYFINKPDAAHPEAINSGTGCFIDQVFGQSWAFQVGLPRVLPERETRAALSALWRYNFTPDVGPYREAYKEGRWYAMPGEAGLLMCTFPRTDWDIAQAGGKGNRTFVGYFNECMNGFEYQVAGHMLWEGMVQEGLAVARAVHDRYHPSRRNPWNEVECGDHYARSMASYGVFLAACGFEYHGPQGHLGFAPRLTPHDFRTAFTAAEGWGTFAQRIAGGRLEASVEVRHGCLRLRTLALGAGLDVRPSSVSMRLGGKALTSSFVWDADKRRLLVTLADAALLTPESGRLTIAAT